MQESLIRHSEMCTERKIRALTAALCQDLSTEADPRDRDIVLNVKLAKCYVPD